MAKRTLHLVISINVAEGATGGAMPVLVLEDGEVSLLCLAWTREQMLVEVASPQKIKKSVKALGRLYDFYMIVEKGQPLTPEQLERMVLRFFEARQFGNNQLGWTPVSRNTAIDDYRYALEFTDFAASNFDHTPINPIEMKLLSDLGIKEQQILNSKMAIKKTWDRNFQLQQFTQEAQGLVAVRTRGVPRKKNKKNRIPKHFPADRVLDLIRSTSSTRDKLFLLLIFFGGLRKSEPFHLYVTDIRIRNGVAVVRLADPIEGVYEWDEKYAGKQKGTRLEFLQQRYNLGPRNKLDSDHPLHAGWKGMTFENDNQEATLQWLIPEIGEYFAHLHTEYMRQYRNHVRDEHPYYFVNTKEGEGFGAPMKMANMDKSFYRCAAKIGLKGSQKGVNPHGARHFFGYFCASHLRLSKEVTQIIMRHAYISSTEVYYSLDIEVARQELEAGQKRLAESIPVFCRSVKRISGGK